MAATLLVDQYGRGLAPSTLYKTPSQNASNYLPVARPRPKTYEAVSAWQRREMVDVSRVIAAGVPNIDDALTFAGDFSIGDSWHIKSRSADKEWGKKRDEWFNQFYTRDCNARGRQNDWWSSLRQFNWTRKVEGDYGIMFDGQPSTDSNGKKRDPTGRFQVIKFDRISTGLIGAGQKYGIVGVGNGLQECNELPKSWNFYSANTTWAVWPGLYVINDANSIFDGQRIIDGVIVDSNMMVLGYRIVGFNNAGMPTYVDVPKQIMHFNFSARRQVDLIRGIPELAEAIIPIMGLDDIQYLVTMAVKLASMLAISRESTDGNPNRSARVVLDEDTTDMAGAAVTRRVAFEELFPGLVELSTANREKLTAMEFNRPSMNEEAFIARIETAVLHKLWPRSLIHSDDTRRAGTRAIAIQANAICAWDQRCVERDARWIGDRATEWGMRMGFVPTNDNLYDPYQYVFTCPGKFTVDEGNDSKMRIASLSRCVISRGMICELDGYLAEEIEEQRECEEHRLMVIAERLSQEHPWLTEKECLLRLDNADQNISFADSSQQQESEDGQGKPVPIKTNGSRNGNAHVSSRS